MRVRGKIRRLITYILIVAFLATSLPLVCLEKAEAGATVIESVTVDKQEVCVGEPFTVTAIATSQNKPLYKFFIGEKKADGGWSWTVIQNYSEKNTLTYAIDKTGRYLISVYVKDSASSNDPDTFKQCSITVTTDNAIYVQDTRTFTVTATDGSQIPQTVSYTEDGVTTTLYLKEVKGYTVTKTEQKPVYRTETKNFTKTVTKTAIPKNDSQFPSTYQINEDGYTGTIPRTKIDWVVNSYYPEKSVTVTKTLTGTSYRDGSGNPPSTTSVTYTDSESGRTVTGSIPKSGSKTITGRVYEYSGSKAENDPVLGYYSDNSTYYCNDGTGWIKYYYYNPPRKPEGYYPSYANYGGPAATHPDDGWTVHSYDWWIDKREPNWQSNNATHGRTNSYYTKWAWTMDGSRRKLVWVKYYRTKAWNWSQKYSGTLTLPKTPKDYKGTATYSGTLSKQVVDHYETIPTEWRAEVVYEGYIRNHCKSISVDPTSFNIYKGNTRQLTVTALFRDGTTKDVTNEATYTTNLLQNGNFNEGFTGWTKNITVNGSAEIVQDETYGNACKITGTKDHQWVHQTFTSLGHGTYTLSGSIKILSHTSSTGLGLALFAHYSDDTYTGASTSQYIDKTKIGVWQDLQCTITTDPSKEIRDIKAYGPWSNNLNGSLIGTNLRLENSSSAGVVTVSPTGLVTGNKAGSARIFVTYNGKSAYVDVNVLDPVVEKITVIPEGGNIIRRGGTTQVITTAIMSDGTIKNVTNEANYESSDPSIATVSDTGLVKGLNVGSVTITAEYDNKADTVKIEVDPKLYIYIRRLM